MRKQKNPEKIEKNVLGLHSKPLTIGKNRREKERVVMKFFFSGEFDLFKNKKRKN
jgi:hypothetical protein